MKGGEIYKYVYEKLRSCHYLKKVSFARRYSKFAKAAAESFLLQSVTAAD